MRKLTLCMMATLLTTLLSSCASNGTREKVFVPDLVFPVFPSLDSGVKNPDEMDRMRLESRQEFEKYTPETILDTILNKMESNSK